MKNMKTSRLVIIVFLILSLKACKTEPEKVVKPERAAKAELSLVGKKLMEVPAGLEAIWAAFSPDGKKALCAVKKGGKQLIVDSGKEGRPYDHIADFVWSPDGRSFAYVGINQGKKSVVVEGREGRWYDDLGRPVFSPDSRLVAYEAKRGDKWYIAVGDKESSGADMHSMEPVFSPDSRLITYFEQHHKENKTFRVVSGANMSSRKTGRGYSGTGAIVFSPDGSRVAYVALRDDKTFLVTGEFANVDEGEKEAELPGPPRFLVFSPDGKKSAYLLERQERQIMIIDGREIDYSRHAVLMPPVFSPDGSKLVSIAERGTPKGAKQYAIVDDKEGKLYDEIGKPFFSPDSSKIAYPARNGDKWFIVVNDQEGRYYDMLLDPVFSHDGSRITYRARKDGKRFVVVADKEGRTIKEHARYDAVWQPVFSPDGKFVAYGAAPALPIRELWWKVEPVNSPE